MPAAKPTTLERRLTFYGWETPEGDSAFDRLEAARALGLLPDNAERKYVRGAYAADVLLNDEGSAEQPTLVTVLRLRDYDNRPYVRAPGDAPAPITMRENQDLLDVSHGAIWGDGVAAFEQGGHAPPPSYLSDFLLARVGQLVIFTALFDRTLVERLRALAGVRAIHLRLHNSPDVQEQADSRLGPFAGLVQRLRGNVQSVVVTQEMRVPSRGKGARRHVLESVTPDDVIQMAEHAESLFDSFTVTGLAQDGRTQTIDLLHERLHIRVALPRSARGGHYTDDDAAFRSLIGARAELDRDGRLRDAVRAETASRTRS